MTKATDKSPLSSSMEANSGERRSRPRIFRKIAKDTVREPTKPELKPYFKSLQAALLQKSGKVKGEDLESLQASKAQKSKGSSEAPIEMITASDLEILRKLKPIVPN